MTSSWGAGSLVEYMAEAGFSPDEIVEAGLAVRTKRQQLAPGGENAEINNTPSEAADGANDEEQHDYSCLMDRFRSRLIIPIFDENGQSVIALGGRHLESAIDDSDGKTSSFKPAKYLNSPDSLVFTKKNVLFNKAKAKQVLEVQSGTGSSSTADNTPSAKDASTFDVPPAVVIVEGYFDAIALSNVGVENVVASMGTALPLEQLKAAADMGNIPGGKSEWLSLLMRHCKLQC
jgi:DNA primase